jgi:hypothetical protein
MLRRPMGKKETFSFLSRRPRRRARAVFPVIDRVVASGLSRLARANRARSVRGDLVRRDVRDGHSHVSYGKIAGERAGVL